MRFDTVAQIVNLRHGERGVVNAHAARSLADVNQPILVAIDERSQQHATDQAKDGGVGSDPECQGENHGNRKSFGARERTGREFSRSCTKVSMESIMIVIVPLILSPPARRGVRCAHDQTFERRSAGRSATLGKI